MNALSTIEQLIRSPNLPVDTLQFVTALVVSSLVGWLVSVLYRVFYEDRATGSQIHRGFLLITPSITALFVAIQFSLPLSLGLVGALTIIRFRTPIKEPEEVSFLMLVIASAIVCATFNYLLLVVLLTLALLLLLLQRYLPRLFRGRRRSEGLLLVTLDGQAGGDGQEALLRILKERLPGGKLQSLSFSDGVTSLHCSFTGLTPEALEGLRAALQEAAPVQKLSVFYNKNGLG